MKIHKTRRVRIGITRWSGGVGKRASLVELREVGRQVETLVRTVGTEDRRPSVSRSNYIITKETGDADLSPPSILQALTSRPFKFLLFEHHSESSVYPSPLWVI
jgi:hypothetical protein